MRLLSRAAALCLALTAATAALPLAACATDGPADEEIVPGDDPKADRDIKRTLVFPLGDEAPSKDYDVSAGNTWFEGVDVTMPGREARELGELFFATRPNAEWFDEPTIRIEVFRRYEDGTIGEQLEERAIGYLVRQKTNGDLVVGDRTLYNTNVYDDYQPGDLLRVRITFIEGRLPAPASRAGRFLDTNLEFRFAR